MGKAAAAELLVPLQFLAEITCIKNIEREKK